MTLPALYRPTVTAALAGWQVTLDGWGAGGIGVTPTVDSNGTCWWVTKLDGWRDRPPTRTASTDRQADHGSFDAPAYLGARTITIEGVAEAATETLANLSADIVASVCTDMTVLTPLVVTEPGRSARQAGVRLLDGTKVGEPYGASSTAFDWQIQLKAPDPRKYALDGTELALTLTLPVGVGVGLTPPVTPPFSIPTGAATNRGTIVNNGTFATRPTVLLYGPSTSPAIANLTTSRTLAFDLTLAAGEVLVVDLAARSVLLNGDVSRAYAITTGSSWWQLEPGPNDIQYQAGTGTGPAILQPPFTSWV